MKTILVTGAAGFIGYHYSKSNLIRQGIQVIGIDNLNNYYDPNLKQARLKELSKYSNFLFHNEDIANSEEINKIFQKYRPSVVVHLAAQAGVRYSVENPLEFIHSNVLGTASVLEALRHYKPDHFLYASSSSVYGNIKEIPFSEAMLTNKPSSTYAATKIANEAQVSAYAQMFGITCTGMRFFTVYGPWGRPDMALYLFTKAIFEGTQIHLNNNGDMYRDNTYVDDIVHSVNLLVNYNPPTREKHEIFNLGNGNKVKLSDFLYEIESCIGKKADVVNTAIPLGDVGITLADTSKLYSAVGFNPDTSIKLGISNFVKWYRDYHAI